MVLEDTTDHQHVLLEAEKGELRRLCLWLTSCFSLFTLDEGGNCFEVLLGIASLLVSLLNGEERA